MYENYNFRNFRFNRLYQFFHPETRGFRWDIIPRTKTDDFTATSHQLNQPFVECLLLFSQPKRGDKLELHGKERGMRNLFQPKKYFVIIFSFILMSVFSYGTEETVSGEKLRKIVRYFGLAQKGIPYKIKFK